MTKVDREETMTVKIAIIGLGQTGASIGLALAKHKDQVTTTGYDDSSEAANKARKLEAVENFAHSLAAAVKDADVVVLTVPLDQVHDTLKFMAQHLHENVVVIDTVPAKQAVAAWAEECLPSGCHHVGLTLALNPLVLDEAGQGTGSARPDLFQNGLAAVTSLHTTAGEAIKLAANFATLLGARPFFADLAEVDGIMSTVSILPALAVAALAETVLEQPGWGDIRKLAGRPFVAAMQPLDAEKEDALAEITWQNRANIVRLLDEYIAALKSLRDDIDGEKKKSFRGRLERVMKGRAQWRKARADGDWQSIESLEQELPTASAIFAQQLGLGKLLGLRRKKDNDD
jgi:prephenate dehydrogenase